MGAAFVEIRDVVATLNVAAERDERCAGSAVALLVVARATIHRSRIRIVSARAATVANVVGAFVAVVRACAARWQRRVRAVVVGVVDIRGARVAIVGAGRALFVIANVRLAIHFLLPTGVAIGTAA